MADVFKIYVGMLIIIYVFFFPYKRSLSFIIIIFIAVYGIAIQFGDSAQSCSSSKLRPVHHVPRHLPLRTDAGAGRRDAPQPLGLHPSLGHDCHALLSCGGCEVRYSIFHQMTRNSLKL